jgi:PAS domain S-box-containing protein
LIAAGTHMDIAAKKHAERNLQVSEARFRALAQLAPVGIFLADATGCIFANEAWSKITGWPLEEGLGLRWVQAIHPDDRAAAQEAWQNAEKTGEGYDMECRYLRPSGEVRWGFVQVRPYPGVAPGELGGYIGIVSDLTERKASDEKLQLHLKSLGDLKFALDQSAIVALTDTKGAILEANEKFTSISGYAQKELLGRTHHLVNSGHHPESFFREMWDTIQSGKVWHGEIQNRAKDGHTYWVDTTITPFLGEDGKPDHYLAIRFDISERHHAEEELRLAHSHLLQAMESIPGAFAVFDSDDRLLRCNSRYLALMPEEIQGTAMGQSFKSLTREILRRQLRLEGDELEERLRIRMENHGHAGMRLQYRTVNGQVLRVEERETEEGGCVILGLDISEDIHREEELEKARSTAESATKAKDQFVAAISHELRAPLQAILGNTELLLLTGEHTLNEAQQKQVRTVMECGERQSRLINELLDLARLDSGRLEVRAFEVALEPLVRSVVSALEAEADKRGVSLLQEEVNGRVLADSNRLDEVLINLISNAVKYNRVGGCVRIRTRVPGPGLIRIEVEDTGMGIPENRQAEVFEAYNRLGRESGYGNGTGLGLSLTRKLVEHMGGRIGFESKPDVGSLFWVELPEA